MSCLAAAAYFSSLSTSFSLLLFLRLLFLLPTSLGLFDVILYESTARKCEHFLFIRHCHNPFSLSLSAVLFAFCACASLTFMSVKNTSASCCGRRFLLSLCLVAVECKHESEQRTQGYSAEIESSARARASRSATGTGNRRAEEKHHVHLHFNHAILFSIVNTVTSSANAGTRHGPSTLS